MSIRTAIAPFLELPWPKELAWQSASTLARVIGTVSDSSGNIAVVRLQMPNGVAGSRPSSASPTTDHRTTLDGSSRRGIGGRMDLRLSAGRDLRSVVFCWRPGPRGRDALDPRSDQTGRKDRALRTTRCRKDGTQVAISLTAFADPRRGRLDHRCFENRQDNTSTSGRSRIARS